MPSERQRWHASGESMFTVAFASKTADKNTGHADQFVPCIRPIDCAEKLLVPTSLHASIPD
jgi:hypothetical protein